MRARKVRVIARFELLTTVRRWAWLFATLGMPLLFATLLGGVSAAQGAALARKASEEVAFGIVDRSGLLAKPEPQAAGSVQLKPEDPRRSARFRAYDEPAAARRAVLDGALRGYFVIPADYRTTGKVAVYLREGGALDGVSTGNAERALVWRLRRALLADTPVIVTDRVLRPYEPSRHYLEANGSVSSGSAGELRAITRLLVPLFLSVLLTMALMGTSSYLVQGIATEKENKVVEVLLSAAKPEEILAGKLLGLGAAGLLQVGVWALMFGSGGVIAATRLAAPELAVPWLALAAAPVYFVLGYLFVGSLMLATGALGNTARESQQLSMLWSTPTLLPVVLAPVLAAEPAGWLPRILTQVPFTAPLTAVLRLSVDPTSIGVLELASSLLLLTLSTWLALRLGARLFRVGLLLTGSRPGLMTLLRQAALRR